jgi:DNA-binding NarL/FixJ family response regulator
MPGGTRRRRGERIRGPSVGGMETTITATDVVKTYALGVRAATAEISRIAGGPRVLVLTTFDTDDDAFAALQAGASGFLLNNAPPADLLTAIRVVAAGDAVVAPRVTRRLLERFAGQFARAGARR